MKQWHLAIYSLFVYLRLFHIYGNQSLCGGVCILTSLTMPQVQFVISAFFVHQLKKRRMVNLS